MKKLLLLITSAGLLMACDTFQVHNATGVDFWLNGEKVEMNTCKEVSTGFLVFGDYPLEFATSENSTSTVEYTEEKNITVTSIGETTVETGTYSDDLCATSEGGDEVNKTEAIAAAQEKVNAAQAKIDEGTAEKTVADEKLATAQTKYTNASDPDKPAAQAEVDAAQAEVDAAQAEVDAAQAKIDEGTAEKTAANEELTTAQALPDTE